jgi:hypothetical protein
VPGEQRARRDQAVAAQPGRQEAGQCGQDRPVGPVQPGPGDLAAQNGDFVAENPDLGVLRRLAATEQLQPAKDPDDGEVQEPDRHSPRSCPITVSRPNRRSQPLHRVLEQYKSAVNGQRPSAMTTNGSATPASVHPAGSENSTPFSSWRWTRSSPQFWRCATNSKSRPDSGWNRCVTRTRRYRSSGQGVVDGVSELPCGAVCRNAAPRVPGSPADHRRAASQKGPGRVRQAL